MYMYGKHVCVHVHVSSCVSVWVCVHMHVVYGMHVCVEVHVNVSTG